MKKKINVILIIVVIALWGGIGYRFLSNYFFTPDQPVLRTYFDSNTDIDNIFVQRDTFVMEPIKRDPFLNKIKSDSKSILVRNNSANNTVKPKQVVTHSSTEIKTYWPKIEYYGYIKSGDNKELVLLNINGSVKKMHIGENGSGVTVNKISRDSIKVSFNKESKVIRHSRLN
ncbi:hypothetical protein [Flavobacterium sp. C4GT6]|uniref:hypothetical protein n=1 Tax=Flavobacterium sp. C4GT6 TaxID=3103818 RepID=UPI002ED49F11|nr:hypothetical protein [Flavobacterium sp. C4GT6]